MVNFVNCDASSRIKLRSARPSDDFFNKSDIVTHLIVRVVFISTVPSTGKVEMHGLSDSLTDHDITRPAELYRECAKSNGVKLIGQQNVYTGCVAVPRVEVPHGASTQCNASGVNIP